jgi:cell division protein FtsL
MILAEKSRMTQTQLERVQRRKIQEGRLKRYLKEIAIYAIFIAILLVIAFSVVDSKAYKYKCALVTLFQLDSDWVEGVYKLTSFIPYTSF